LFTNTANCVYFLSLLISTQDDSKYIIMYSVDWKLNIMGICHFSAENLQTIPCFPYHLGINFELTKLLSKCISIWTLAKWLSENCPYLVEAEDVDGATQVDAVWADAVNQLTPQSLLCKHYPSSHCSRKCWRHNDCNKIQSANNHVWHTIAPADLRRRHLVK